VAQIFFVHCPACGGKFPCHTELWHVAFDLLCPFCQRSFPPEASPLIITPTGERRSGTLAPGAAGSRGVSGDARPPASSPDSEDRRATAESM
jgi:hypothetical protein